MSVPDRLHHQSCEQRRIEVPAYSGPSAASPQDPTGFREVFNLKTQVGLLGDNLMKIMKDRDHLAAFKSSLTARTRKSLFNKSRFLAIDNEDVRVKKRIWGMLAGGTFLLSVGVAGIAHASAPPESSAETREAPGVLTELEASEVYSDLVGAFPFTMPDGAEFPGLADHRSAARSVDVTVYYEPGAVEGRAYFFWQCSWMNEALNAHSAADKTAETRALDELLKWDTTDFYADHVEEVGGSWIGDVVEPALQGEYGPMQQSFSAGCATETVGSLGGQQ